MRSLSYKSERGVAAVEFALVIPYFLVIVAIMLTMCRGFWSLFLMMNIASATTRTCVNVQNTTTGTDSSGAMISCAQSQGAKFLSQYGSGLCPGSQLTVEKPTTTLVSAASETGSTSQVRFLQYTLRCNMPLLMFWPPNWSPTTVPLVARSTYPFIN